MSSGAVAAPGTFFSALSSCSQRTWNDTVDRLVSSIHPVDQNATRIWFAFWPLKLAASLRESEDLQQTVRQLELDGRYRLEEQMDSSVRYLYGSRFWPSVKEAVLRRAQEREEGESPDTDQLERVIRNTAGNLADRLSLAESLLLGITAIGFMALQQVGPESFLQTSQPKPARSDSLPDPDKIVRSRRTPRRRFLNLLRTVDKRYTVTFDESRRDGHFEVIQGQDISMAAQRDPRDYRSQDPRCDEGPIPFQCRTASCGYCWIGILAGESHLIELSDYEKRRLHYFGYLPRDREVGSHPVIRLACQAKCYGDVHIVIPPWNGVLDGRR